MEYVKKLETRVHELEKQETDVNCPESVFNALQVLQVCQGLEDDDIGDQEKALVRQMCNVSCFSKFLGLLMNYITYEYIY